MRDKQHGAMKVRVCYTVHVPARYRRAINFRYGRPGLASRAEVQAFLQAHGKTLDDDIIYELGEAEKRGEA